MRKDGCSRMTFVAAHALAAMAVCFQAHAQVPMAAKALSSVAGARNDATMVKPRVAILRQTAATFRQMAASLPAEALPAELADAQAYARWLSAKADQMDALAGRGEGAISGGTGAGAGAGPSAIGGSAGGSSQDQLLGATRNMQETQMSFNLQYLQLQSQMEHEHRSYTALSNIMKTRHDAVRHPINNVR